MDSEILNIEEIVMGRGLPDPPPQAPPEKPAEPYKTIILNGPPGAPVQSCKWSEITSFIYLKLLTKNCFASIHFCFNFFSRPAWKPAVFSVLYHILQCQSQGKAYEEESPGRVQAATSAGDFFFNYFFLNVLFPANHVGLCRTNYPHMHIGNVGKVNR